MLSLGDGNSHWRNDWKPIIDMLLMFIHHPKRIKSHLRLTLDVIASNLDEKVNLFCPDSGRETDELMFRSYKGKQMCRFSFNDMYVCNANLSHGFSQNKIKTCMLYFLQIS